MKKEWVSLIKLGFISETAGGIFALGIVLFMSAVDVSFPIIETKIPPLDLPTIVVNLFSAIITICGVIIGFFAVCVFFGFEWSDRKMRIYDEQARKERNTSVEKALKLRNEILATWRDGISRYSEHFMKTSILLLFAQIVSFFYCQFSGVFLGVNMLVEINSLLIVASGIYPIMRSVFWYKEPERE